MTAEDKAKAIVGKMLHSMFQSEIGLVTKQKLLISKRCAIASIELMQMHPRINGIKYEVADLKKIKEEIVKL